ncbi:hypothetical protein ABW20_dc0101964 [Dactylellina cionopaga]|nr:hypothetical protein ABW20_dc0101964 [Dactylellina cionopaga]
MNTVTASVSRSAGRTLRSRAQSQSPTIHSVHREQTMMLSFLYPVAARRFISNHFRVVTKKAITNRPASSQCLLTKRQYSSSTPNPVYNLPLDESNRTATATTATATTTATTTDVDTTAAWGYLFGEGSLEEEQALRPKRTDRGSIFDRRGRSAPTGSAKETDSSHSFLPSDERYGSRLGRRDYFSGHDAIADDPSMHLASAPGGRLTEREKVIFDMIFDKLLQRKGNLPQAKLEHKRPSPMISALFESAVGPQKSGDEVSFGPERTHGMDDKGSMEAVLAKGDFPISLRYAAAEAMGLSRQAAGLQSDEDTAERTQEYSKLKGMLELSMNDLEIWEWLDEYIFPMAGAVAPSAANSGKKKDAAPTNEPTVPSSNYPKLLCDAINAFRTLYRDFPACIAIFEKIKQLGPESYIIGCSVAVYNEMLYVRWQGYRDIQGVVDLLNEMRLNGVEGNVETATIVSDVLNDVKVFESNSFLPGTVMMWSNEIVLDGKEKLRQIMGAVVREGDERGLRELEAAV